MDFLDFAKEIESLGREQYSVLARTMQIRELSGIFEFMADQEKRHYELFDSWQRNNVEVSASDLPAETVIGQAKDAFERIAGHFLAKKFVPPINYEQAYKQALEFEKRSIALYEEALPKIADDRRKKPLTSIIEQEHAHARFINALMDFLRHPGEWLENAEWRHMEEF
jgi:rubrerythrin